MARRKYAKEFKLSAVRLVNQQGYSVADAAKSLGVDPNSVRYWVGKYGKEGGTDGVSPGGEGAVQAELRRLRGENARLVMERDILKKAAALFAKEQL